MPVIIEIVVVLIRKAIREFHGDEGGHTANDEDDDNDRMV